MPARAVKGPEGEAIWKRAVSVADEQYPDLKKKDSSHYYGVVMTIYKSMCKKHACTPKRESDMSMILNRIELFESVNSLPSDYYGWQLREPLTSEMKEVTREAIRDLNSNMRKAMSDLNSWMMDNNIDESNKDDMSRVGSRLSNIWGKYIKPVIENKKYSETGITDIEPIYEAGQRLINHIKQYYDITGWTNLGDYIS